MNVVLFEDRHVDDNRPATLARPAFAVTCGGANLYDTVGLFDVSVRTVIREYLADTARASFPSAEGNSSSGPALFLNAALVPDVAAIRKLVRQAEEAEPFLATSGQRVAAALLPDASVLGPTLSPENVSAMLLEQKLPLRDEALPTIDYPFHIVKFHAELLESNLAERVGRGGYKELSRNVHVGRDVKIAASAVLNAEAGPIVLDDNVTVMDFAYLAGPLYVGRSSRVIERSSIKEHTCVGRTCKIGGEVECAVIESYSNKQHHGFLGHAYVGSWVNLGAGTSNSDLKNTYGKVRVEVGGGRVETDMQFFGCAIGDHSKTAINTSIFTGKIIGVASMLYGFVSTNVPSFCNYARSFGQITEVAVETAIETERRMFLRRDIEQLPEDVALMRKMYQMTREERIMATEPLAL